MSVVSTTDIFVSETCFCAILYFLEHVACFVFKITSLVNRWKEAVLVRFSYNSSVYNVIEQFFPQLVN